MLHRNLADVSGHTINQSVGVRIRTVVFNNFVRQKSVHYFETGKVKIFWLVQHERRDPVVETASKISEPGMFLLDIMAVNHVVILAL